MTYTGSSIGLTGAARNYEFSSITDSSYKPKKEKVDLEAKITNLVCTFYPAVIEEEPDTKFIRFQAQLESLIADYNKSIV